MLFDNTTFVDYWPFAPLQHFAVQVPPSASTASGGVLQYLRDIPAAEVSRLRASVQRVRRRFYFPRTASLHQEGDANPNPTALTVALARTLTLTLTLALTLTLTLTLTRTRRATRST